ncbi:hypothetical protein [Streptomyces sp. NPDC059786]|uniref:hypothetical protein n=1 Tax=Streptomyces sp. NPDC059786 TaxID=3346946 RepID=UPI00365953E8
MSEHGGEAAGPPRTSMPRSKLADYAEMAGPSLEAENSKSTRSALDGAPSASASTAPRGPTAPPDDDVPVEDPQVAERRRWYEALLDEFRRTAVLVPLGEGPGPDDERGLLTADLNGIRFILAFSDEQALGRYAKAREGYHREWTYQTVLGARLLDVAVPAAGVPCGVALDCADGPDGAVFPPVRGVVPEEAAVDADLFEERVR